MTGSRALFLSPAVVRLLAVAACVAVSASLPARVHAQVAPTASGSPDALASLQGTVRAEGYRGDGVLVGAIVEVRQGGRFQRAVVDSAGRYRLTGLQPGRASLRVLHVVTHPLDTEVLLPSGGELTLDLSLGLRIIHVPGVRVRAMPALNEPVEPLALADLRTVSLAIRALEVSSGMTESGLASAFPGDEGGEPERVLYLRGSTVDARLVLLDDAPILTPFHVAGLVEPFQSELLGNANLYLGGAPSPYDGGISYLLDMDTRAPRTDRVRASGAADGVSIRGSAELPLPLGGGLLLGGRSLHGLQERLGGAPGLPYDYEDLLVRVGFGWGGSHALRATAFTNSEAVRLDLGDAGGDVGDARWGNRLVSVGYSGAIGRIGLEAVGASSRYGSSLPVSWEDPVLARGEAERERFGGHIAAPAGVGTVRIGGSLERVRFGYRLEPLGATLTTTVGAGEEDLTTTLSGVFGEWEGSLSGSVHLRAGLRGDLFGHEGDLRVGPRVQLRLALSDRAALVGSAGRYHQVLPAPGLRKEVSEGEAFPAALGWEPGLPVVSATHVLLGLEQELDRGFRFGVSGFMKSFSGLGPDGSRGRSSGTELRVSHAGERVEAWIGYALSWFWTDDGVDGATRFRGRHLVSMGIDGKLRGLELRGVVGYGAGIPLSPVEIVGAPATGVDGPGGGTTTQGLTPSTETRLSYGGGDTPLEVAPQDDFLRLDVEAGWLFRLGLPGGGLVELRPYVKVLNALDRRDALFYYFDRWRDDGLRPVTTRPFLPIAGVEWRF